MSIQPARTPGPMDAVAANRYTAEMPVDRLAELGKSADTLVQGTVAAIGETVAAIGDAVDGTVHTDKDVGYYGKTERVITYDPNDLGAWWMPFGFYDLTVLKGRKTWISHLS